MAKLHQTTRYLESAIKFFKSKFDIKEIDCKIEFRKFSDLYPYSKKFNKDLFFMMGVLGTYNQFTNTIRIEGVELRSRNELVVTLFHELIHWWQYCIVKKLHYAYTVDPPLKCGCHDIVENFFDEKPVLNDYYHPYTPTVSRYVRPKLCYNKINTENIAYRDKPHEIEAREMADKLFKEWNMPENKGK